MTDGPSPFLNIAETAARLRVPVSRMYEWTRQVGPNAIPRYKAGKRLVFLWDEVLEWFTSTQRAGMAPSPRPRRLKDSWGTAGRLTRAGIEMP